MAVDYQDDDPVVEVLDDRDVPLRCTRCAMLERHIVDLERQLQSVVEGIGYDIRQLARCPRCNSIDTLPFDKVHVGSLFVCRACGNAFYLIRALDTTPEGINRAKEAAALELPESTQKTVAPKQKHKDSWYQFDPKKPKR